jgi:23S rRNA pseudouridine955/2504/2580 synthase
METTLVDAEEAGLRLDRWFKRHFPELGHGPLEKLLRTGQVRVDGKRAKSSDRIEAGQAIRIPPQLSGAQTAAEDKQQAGETLPSQADRKFMQALVMYEDPQLFVLNKPSGLPTQGGSGITRHIDGLLVALQGKKRHRPRLVHRLDRDTSGVLLVARTQKAAADLSESLRRRDAQKIYWALTKGVPKPLRGTINLALAKEQGFGASGRDERMAPADEGDEGAKTATTHYAVMDQAGSEYAFVALKPVTGRTHQIRAHLAAIGTPIVGDFKYGGADAKGMGQLEDRLHLHARSIDIAHPEEVGRRLKITAPLPPHMRKAWELLGFDLEDVRDPFAVPRRKK